MERENLLATKEIGFLSVPSWRTSVIEGDTQELIKVVSISLDHLILVQLGFTSHHEVHMRALSPTMRRLRAEPPMQQ